MLFLYVSRMITCLLIKRKIGMCSRFYWFTLLILHSQNSMASFLTSILCVWLETLNVCFTKWNEEKHNGKFLPSYWFNSSWKVVLRGIIDFSYLSSPSSTSRGGFVCSCRSSGAILACSTHGDPMKWCFIVGDGLWSTMNLSIHLYITSIILFILASGVLEGES